MDNDDPQFSRSFLRPVKEFVVHPGYLDLEMRNHVAKTARNGTRQKGFFVTEVVPVAARGLT